MISIFISFFLNIYIFHYLAAINDSDSKNNFDEHIPSLIKQQEDMFQAHPSTLTTSTILSTTPHTIATGIDVSEALTIGFLGSRNIASVTSQQHREHHKTHFNPNSEQGGSIQTGKCIWSLSISWDFISIYFLYSFSCYYIGRISYIYSEKTPLLGDVPALSSNSTPQTQGKKKVIPLPTLWEGIIPIDLDEWESDRWWSRLFQVSRFFFVLQIYIYIW